MPQHSAKAPHSQEKTNASPTKGKRTFANTFFARPRPLHILILIVSIAFGTALVTQVRAQQINPLDRLSEAELVELLSELDSREDSLEEQRADLTEQLRELDSQANQQEAMADAANKLKLQADIAAGLVPVSGQGIVVGIANPHTPLTAQVFVTTIAELRNAGAEAIEVNDVRLTARSWFMVDDGQVVVDGVALSAPYTLRAIGDPDKLSSGIELHGGAASQMRIYGATVTVKRQDSVDIDSIAQPFVPQWAEIDSQ